MFSVNVTSGGLLTVAVCDPQGDQRVLCECDFRRVVNSGCV